MNWLTDWLEWLMIPDAIEWAAENYPESIIDYGLDPMLSAAVAATWLAGAVLLINVVFRRWLSAGQLCWLWGLVLVRLLIPVAPESRLSLQNIPAAFERIQEDRSAAALGLAPAAASLSGDSASAAAEPAAESPSSASESMLGWIDLLVTAVALSWPIGVVVVIGRTVAGQWWMARRLSTAMTVRDERILSVWQACCAIAARRQPLPILATDAVDQPALYGVLRPRLLLPAGILDLDDARLRMVMLHELAHLHRHDLLVNWWVAAVRTVHWCNPIAWLATARLHSLREQACDAFALRALGAQQARAYSELLIELATRAPVRSRWQITMPVSVLGLLRPRLRRWSFRNRLRSLPTAATQSSPRQVALVSTLFAGLAISGLTDANATPAPLPSYSGHPQFGVVSPDGIRASPGWSDSTQSRVEGPVVERDYDLTDVMAVCGTHSTTTGSRTEVASSLRLIVAGLAGLVRKDGTDSLSDEQFRMTENVIHLTGPERWHREVERVMHVWTEGGCDQIVLECRMLKSSFDYLASNWERIEAATVSTETELFPETDAGTVVTMESGTYAARPVAVAKIDDQRLGSLVKRVQGDPRSYCVFAPKFTVFNGQNILMASVLIRPFVTGLRLTEEHQFQPKIQTFDDGMKINLRPELRRGSEGIQLSGRIEFNSVDEIKTVRVVMAGDRRSIQLPTVQRTRIDISTRLPEEMSLVLGWLPTDKDEDCTYVVLTPRVLKE